MPLSASFSHKCAVEFSGGYTTCDDVIPPDISMEWVCVLSHKLINGFKISQFRLLIW